MNAIFPEIQVAEPLVYKTLSVFPLFSETNGHVEYMLSDEAISSGTLTVEEVSAAGSVPQLLVRNNGNQRVLFIEGEELVGAKQNRILNASFLIAANSHTKIFVSCVEQGRWAHKTRCFDSTGRQAPSKLRSALKGSVNASLKAERGYSSDQAKVWDVVGATQAACCVRSETGAMSDTFDALGKRIKKGQKKLEYVSGASGVAMAIGPKLVVLDLFDKPQTCEKVWPRLLTGLLVDALEYGPQKGRVQAADVEQMLRCSVDGDWTEASAIGEGTDYRCDTKQSHASALCLQSHLVHGSVVTN